MFISLFYRSGGELELRRAAFFRSTLLIAVIVFSTASGFAARKERRIDSWKPLNYDISLTFNNQLNEITKARAVITVQAIKEVSLIDLDFGELSIDSMTVEGRAATFARVPGRINISFAAPLAPGARAKILVEYHGRPTDGLILSNDKAGKPSAVGDNWPDRVHHWIPCFDHPSAKASVTFTITAPSANLVVGNGKLVSVENSENTRTWTYSETAPIPPYCMIIAVGQFAKIDGGASVTPLTYYVPLLDQKYAVQGFSAANPSLKFFSETIAPYPYAKLAMIVGATRFGGMENSSAIVFPNQLLSPNTTERVSEVFKIREGLVDVVAHEIAHQWFGDSVTESTWADLWLSEGFATYFAGLMIQRYEGEARFRAYMLDAATAYFSFEKRSHIPIHDTETENLFMLLNANSYQKGAWVLHMLRAELGDDAFFRGIRAFYKEHTGGLASSEDLRTAMETASRKNLKEFFARWIYGPGHPRYELSWSWNKRTKRIRLVLDQTQPETTFPNVVPVEIVNGGRKLRVSLKPEQKRTVQELRLNQVPSAVTLDPENVILDESRVSKKS